MRFKDFFKEELRGLFGSPVKVNPVKVDQSTEKEFYKPPTSTKKGGSTITRMMRSDKMLASSPRPSGETPKHVTIASNFDKKPEFFKMPQKPKQVKSPLNLS